MPHEIIGVRVVDHISDQIHERMLKDGECIADLLIAIEEDIFQELVGFIYR